VFYYITFLARSPAPDLI